MRLSVNILFTKKELQLHGHETLNRLSTVSMITLEQYCLVRL